MEMMTPIQESYAYIDRFMDRVGKRTAELGRPIRCAGPGCFWCCKEMVYAERQEVKDMLSRVSDEAKAELRPKVQAWWDLFESSGMNRMPHPDEIKGKDWLMRYRALNLWCPMLNDGACSVYQDRPLGCRYHAAVGGPKRCEDDELRKKQKFVNVKEHAQANTTALALQCQYAPQALFEFDHLGVWLGHFLLGKTERSHGAQTALIKQTEPTMAPTFNEHR